jgi:hypothetical protein
MCVMDIYLYSRSMNLSPQKVFASCESQHA